jgi:uncharacterized protein (TIGR03382 family)
MANNGARPTVPPTPRSGAQPSGRRGAAELVLVLLAAVLVGAAMLGTDGPTRPPADTGLDTGALDTAAPDTGTTPGADGGTTPGADGGTDTAAATDSAEPCDTGTCAEVAQTSGSGLAGEKGGFGCSAAPVGTAGSGLLGGLALLTLLRRRRR